MRLKRLDLTAYGKFTGKSLDFGAKTKDAPDFHLVIGHNEAGKSTAFDAYLALMFGIARETPYNFLHAYKSLEIGGAIELDGRIIEARRFKADKDNLRGPNNEVLAPGIFGAALGSLTRDAYRQMFLLDEASLRDGGKQILQSKGELGAMLFAASSGLTEMSARLAKVEEEFDKLHKKSAQRTALREASLRLEELRKQQNAIETSAVQYEKLRKAAEQTQASYMEAQDKLREARRASAHHTHLASALPLYHRLRQEEAERAPLAHRPAPPSGWRIAADGLIDAEARLASAVQQKQGELERLTQAISAITPDARLLALRGWPARIAPLRSRFDSAIDILKLEREWKGYADSARADLRKLDLPEETDAATVLIAAPLAAELSDLANRHSSLALEAKKSAQELQRAEDAIADLPELREETEDADPFAPLLAQFDKGARETAITRLEQDLRNAQAQAARISVAPFAGDDARLATRPAPDIRVAQRVATAHAETAKALADAERKAAEAQHKAELANEKANLLGTSEGLISEVQLADLADQRAALWRAHLTVLDATSAEAYHRAAEGERQALRTNLHAAARFGELKSVARHAAEAALEDRQAKTVLAQARDAHATSQNALAVLLLACDLPEGMHADDLAPWLEKRRDKLDVLESIASKEAELSALHGAAREETAALAQAMAALGMSVPADATRSTLIELAQTAARDFVARRERRRSAAKQAEKLRADAEMRKHDARTAENALKAWQGQWSAALQRCWLGHSDANSVVAVKAVLDILAGLSITLDEMRKLRERIAAMEQDKADFADAVATAIAQSGLVCTESEPARQAEALAEAIRAAEEAERNRAARIADQQRAESELQGLRAQEAALAAQRAAMFAFYGVSDTAGLRDAISEAETSERLLSAIARTRGQLLDALGIPAFDEAEALLSTVDRDLLTANAKAASEEEALLQEQVNRCAIAAHDAKKALDAVGSEGEAARIAQARQTTRLEIEEIATRYARLKLGSLAVENALARYRDAHRSAMLADAARRFEHITAGSFSDLRTKPEGRSERLVAVRENGTLEDEAMSTGTRAQLFLALRLAGYAEYVKDRPALPFIADDIMETFDNPRSAATFEMLAEIARLGQVIYFSHHEHLVEIARAVIGPGLNVLRLE